MYEIGKITTTHGIRGEVKVIDLSDFNRFKKNEKVFIIVNNEKLVLTIENIKSQVKNLIIKFKEFNNINEVELYKGCDLYLPKDKVEEALENDEYLISDLIGLNVFLTFKGLSIYSETRGELDENEFYLESLYDLLVYNNDNNELIGYVDDILELPHGNVLVVINNDTNKKTMIPFEKDFIKEVTEERILITPIEGLL